MTTRSIWDESEPCGSHRTRDLNRRPSHPAGGMGDAKASAGRRARRVLPKPVKHPPVIGERSVRRLDQGPGNTPRCWAAADSCARGGTQTRDSIQTARSYGRHGPGASVPCVRDCRLGSGGRGQRGVIPDRHAGDKGSVFSRWRHSPGLSQIGPQYQQLSEPPYHDSTAVHPICRR